MAKIFKVPADVNNDDDYDLMTEYVEAYWFVPEAEKVFPIPYWKIKQLLIASTSEEIALKVTDIPIPTLVNAEWVVFEDGDDETLGNSNYQPNDYYFVINEETVERIRESASDVSIENLLIGGRIGKSEDNEGDTVYHAFFYAFEYKPLDPGGGGDGATSGVRIPPGGED